MRPHMTSESTKMLRRTIASGRSCLECSRRKIKCDRSLPCSYCMKVRVQCGYPPVRQVRTSPSPVDADILGRVERIEETLQTLERGLVEIRGLLQIRPAEVQGVRRTLSSESQTHEILSPGNNLAAIIHDPRGDGENRISLSGGSDGLNGAPKPLHPSAVGILSLWQHYLENVDPVLKIFHVPTVQKRLIGVVQRPMDLDSITECLLFAIYYGAVVSLPSGTCQDEYGEEKQTLLQRYRTGVERILALIIPMKLSDITILQAFMIYLICGRNDTQGPDTKKLLPTAIEMAFRNKIHLEGASLDLSPFETEMRRRLWWQIFVLDIRTAEDQGSEPLISSSSFTIKVPSNIDEANLHPEMSRAPSNNPAKTEMLFTLIRIEGSSFARQIVFSDKFCRDNSYDILSVDQKCEAINQFRNRIEKQYLSNCDGTIPLDFVTAASIRLILVKLKLTVCRPLLGTSVWGLVRKVRNYREIAVEILRKALALREYERGTRWLWLFQTYIEWDALALILVDLCVSRLGDQADEAWEMVERVHDYWKGKSHGRYDRRWGHIEELRIRALSFRDSMMEGSSSLEMSVEDQSQALGMTPVSLSPSLGAGTSKELVESENVELPGTGTACQWSTTAFEHYFHALDWI
ncbi:fungal-specific transcription factor [Aspergillus ellipticus CBS 707.79]|uniref:Fungal-specific transcription factor n=1 Tax=Aspergillus ellipticus CBS 707.79 TaxID=1448320 RepID=A0A319DDK0_9EURO|nr:fungal-specific transcription factor [Aspergillus ellipticus CBS 707.79]